MSDPRCDILPTLTLKDSVPLTGAGRNRSSRFIGEPLQEPSACRHGMSHRVAIPDSGNAVLYSQSDSTTWRWLYPDPDFTSTVPPHPHELKLLPH